MTDTSRPNMLLASLMASLLAGLVLMLRVVVSGDGALSGLGGPGEVLVALAFLLGTIWAFALTWGVAAGLVLAAADQLFGLSATAARARSWLGRDPRADRIASAALLAGLACAGIYLMLFVGLYASRDEDFLLKIPVASKFLAAGSLAILAVSTALVLPLTRLFERALAAARVDRLRSPRWPLTLRVLATLAVLFAVGLAAGTALLLRNEEAANVRQLPLFLLSLALLHGVTLWLLLRVRGRRAVGRLLAPRSALATTGVALGLLVATALGLDAAPAVHEAAEVRSETQAMLLRPLRSALDWDSDGYSALLAGGDCDDFDPGVGPHAREIAGNGIDEDCQGGDADPGALAAWEADPTLLADDAGNEHVPEPSPPGGATPTAKPPTTPEPSEVVATAEELKGPPALPRKGLNVVFVLVDTLRPDHMGFYGYERETTPAMDAFARESVVFRWTYAQANNTPRSIPAIFTSKFPSDIKWLRKDRNYPRLLDKETLLGEMFRDAGYRLEAETSHHYFEKKRNIQQGFHEWNNAGDGAGTIKESNVAVASPDTVPRAIERLERLAKTRAEQPFFLFVHLYEPHASYISHKGGPDFGRTLVDRYDGEIRFTDGWFEKLVTAIDDLGLREDTLVVLTSDHGEAFREHGHHFHGQSVYNEEIRVPLMLRIPGVPHRVIEERSALVDVLPTMLAAVDAEPPQDLQGVDLVPVILHGKRRGLPIYSELLPYPNWPEDQRALILGHHKVIYTKKGNGWELYDLATDPLEQDNLFRTHPKAATYKAALLDWINTKVGVTR